MSEMVDRAAAAMLAVLTREDSAAFHHNFEPKTPAIKALRFDGEMDLTELARAVIEELAKPTESMRDRGNDAAGSLAITGDSSGEYTWTVMIREALR